MKKIANMKYITIIIAALSIIMGFLIELTLGNFHYYFNDFKGTEKLTDVMEIDATDKYVISLKTTQKYIDELQFKASINDWSYNVVFTTSYQNNNNYKLLNDEIISRSYKEIMAVKIHKKTDEIRLIFDKELKGHVNLTDIKINNNFAINHFKVITISAIIFLILDFVKMLYQDKKNKLSIYFLKLALITGIISSLATPIYYGWDEREHFIRAYNLANGNYLQMPDETTMWPSGLHDVLIDSSQTFIPHTYTSYKNYMKYLAKSSDTSLENVEYTSTAIPYLFPAYMVSGLGVYLAKTCHLSFPFWFYFGRIFNVVCYALIVSLAIKVSGKIGKFIFALGLVPTTIFLGSCFSADMLTNAFSLLAIGLTFHYRDSKLKVGLKEIILLTCVYVLSFVSKIAYFPLSLLILLIPKKQFKNEKLALVYKVCVSLLGIAVFAVGTLYANKVGVVQWTLVEGINDKEQLVYILTHPFNYLYCLYNTLQADMLNYIVRSMVSLARYLQLGMIDFVILIIGFVLLVGQHSNLNIKTRDKIILLLIVLLCLGSSMSAMYLSFTPVGAPLIEGYQGRYMIPMFCLILLLFVSKKFTFKLSDRSFTLLLYGMYLLVHIHMLIFMTSAFYV